MSCRAAAAAMVPNEHWRSTPRCIHRGLNRRSSFIVHRSSFSPAFTLVELLVVIAIIVTVSAIVVPLLTPVLDSRRIRESARIISTQFASAQSEAMAKGRPVGVWIERLGAGDTTSTLDRSAAMDLYLCEVPQVYAGDTVNSRVQVAMQSGIAGFKFNTTSDFSWNQTDFLCPGDLIRFDFRGPYYEIVGASSATSQPNNMVVTPQPNASNPSQQRPYLDPANNQRQQGYQFVPVNKAEFNPSSGLPLYYHLPPTVQNSDQGAVGVTMAYQIFRQPVKSSTQPVQLPAGSVIDLFASGTASTIPYFGLIDTLTPNTKFTTDRNPIIITFSKSGALDSFYMMGAKAQLTEPIHFLLGQRENCRTSLTTPPIRRKRRPKNITFAIWKTCGFPSTRKPV